MHIQDFARFLLMGSVSVALAGGCKAKEKTSETGEEVTTPTPTTEPLPKPPVVEAIDAAGATVLGEAAVILLDAKAEAKVQWTQADTTIVLRAAFGEGSKAVATVYAAVGDAPEAKVFECKDLEKSEEPRVEALMRGTHVHLLCIRPPQGDDTGFTDGKRLALDATKMTLEETGSYGGEGIVDPDTIDLDEGGM